MRSNAATHSCSPTGVWNKWPDDGSRMNREVLVRFCERVGLRCPARLTFVEGRLRTREWENNGSNVRRTEIVATRVQFLGALRDTKVEEPAKDPDLIDDPDVSL